MELGNVLFVTLCGIAEIQTIVGGSQTLLYIIICHLFSRPCLCPLPKNYPIPIFSSWGNVHQQREDTSEVKSTVLGKEWVSRTVDGDLKT